MPRCIGVSTCVHRFDDEFQVLDIAADRVGRKPAVDRQKSVEFFDKSRFQAVELHVRNLEFLFEKQFQMTHTRRVGDFRIAGSVGSLHVCLHELVGCLD